jgi:undecaprenyl-diphosphatase
MTTATRDDQRAHGHRTHAHRHLPLTPAKVLLVDEILVVVVAAMAVVLAFLAAYDGGSVLLTWDEPIQRFVEDNRGPSLDELFRQVSRLGSNIVIFPVAAVMAALSWRRCRPLALFVVASALLRPPMEFIFKELVDRDRPDIVRMVDGTGPSHPSGHVLASLAVWGLLPAVVAIVTGSRRWWRVSVAAVMVLIPFIAASRVYLGVHWATDVFQGLLIGSLYLLVVEVVFLRWHPDGGCGEQRPGGPVLSGPPEGRAPL